MSIEQLQDDLKQVIGAVPSGPLVTAPEIAAYLKNNLLPLVESTVDELAEVDGSVGDLVTQAQDVLHEDSAQVFAGIIASGKVLISELRTRIGNDHRLLKAIKEWEELAKEGAQLLDDITIPDDEEEQPEAPAVEKPAEEGKAE